MNPLKLWTMALFKCLEWFIYWSREVEGNSVVAANGGAFPAIGSFALVGLGLAIYCPPKNNEGNAWTFRVRKMT